MKKIIAASLIALVFNSFCVLAQTDPGVSEKDFATAMDAFAANTMKQLPDLPAVAVVVIKDDRPVFVNAYGMADREAGLKADADTMFYIASSTKSFTALAAALLDREGRIKLGDQMTKYADGINFTNPIPDRITIRDLLTHTSGLRNDALVFRMAFSGDSAPADMSRVFAEGTTFSDAAFGKYGYTNLGYNIYGVLLQQHLKTKWQDLLQERIFDPLRMRHTTAYVSRAKSKKWKVATGYGFSGVEGKTVRSPLPKTDGNMQSAGGMYASIADLGTWLTMNMNEGKLRGRQVFPAEIIRAAHTGYTRTTRESPPFTGDGEYGLGWQIGKYKNEKVIYHHGGFSGYQSHVSFLPEKKIGVAVLVNNDSVGGRAGHMLATYAYDRLLGAPDVEADYAKRLRDLVTAYERGKQQQIAGAAERAKRTSQLTRPLADYAARYRNPIFGTIEVAPRGNELEIKMGNIKTIAMPFTEKETIRVEIIPGQGEVIKFLQNGEDKIGSLTYSGQTFARIGG